MENKRTQYTKYHEKMRRIIKENTMGNFSFLSDRAFEEYGDYFLRTVRKDGCFKLYRYINLYRYDAEKKIFSLDLENLFLTKNGLHNDVFEGLPQSDYTIYSQDICVQKLSNIAYSKCFSETYRNNLMWAHYADSHKGVCIEYDISKLPDGLLKEFFPVVYSKKRIMYANTELLVEQKDNSEGTEALRDAKGIFLSKADFWKYEKEWRVCQMNYGFCKENVLKIPFDCVSAIYMGVRIGSDDIHHVEEALNTYNDYNQKHVNRIRLYKMKMPKDNSYNLLCEERNY